MSIEALLSESLQLLVLGMGSVFLILGMMILLIQATSHGLARWMPEEPMLTIIPTTSSPSGEDEERIAVIQAAIRHYRARRQYPMPQKD